MSSPWTEVIMYAVAGGLLGVVQGVFPRWRGRWSPGRIAAVTVSAVIAMLAIWLLLTVLKPGLVATFGAMAMWLVGLMVGAHKQTKADSMV